jgi:acyl transferase domain-containing protein
MSSDRDQTSELSPLKRALFAVKDLRARLDAVERARTEPIAVVGMACRFPGAPDLDSFWRLLDEGIDAIGDVPPDRWDVDAFYDPDPDAPGKTYARQGGFLKDVDRFDAGFFGIAPREVVSMDPQQRVLLEVTWEALENAGVPPTALAGTRTGVFVGMGTNDYAQLTIQNDDPNQIDAYMGTGGASCVAAGRISYILGLHGPTMAIDTACSSSLVAVDLAVQQLRAGRCAVAIAGGVNLILSPVATVYLSRVHALSPSSRCRAFDAAADGYVRGEGCGMVVLKRLSDAQRDGDTIRAVIRGSASNHDGRSSGLTVPNGQAQQAVIRLALQDAGVSPADVDYIEAHGTGTPLGDPIELRALSAVLGESRGADTPFLVGTVKTNIGHLEAAAGVAGLIKVILAMEHGRIPASLHFQEPNPHVPWSDLPIGIAASRTAWPDRGRLPLAGVSAFGFSGTNAHIVVEAAPPAAAPADASAEGADRTHHVLALSAATPSALRELAARYEAVCAGQRPPAAADLAFSSNTGRASFDYRLAVVGSSTAELARGLRAHLSGQEDQSVLAGHVTELPRIAFLFTGQGSQYAGMGRELYEAEPAFRAAMDRCDALLTPQLGRSLLSVIFASPETDAAALVDQTAYTQPSLFAVEYSLAELWRSWGVEPAFVMGHSVGEYAAACVAGLFSLEDGIQLIAERARLMQSLPAGGRMAAVFADEDTVRSAIQMHASQAAIAAINGPEHTVISGDGAAIEHVLAQLTAAGVRSKALVVSHAFHSPLMDPILEPFGRAASRVAFGPSGVRLISNLTGDVASGADLGRAEYWRRHLREPVRFSASVATLAAQGCTAYVEIGPNPTLLGMAARCVPDGAGLWLPSLRKGARDGQQILKALGALYAHGVAIDWKGVDRDRRRSRVALPAYPFQRERYWINVAKRRTSDAGGDHGERSTHPLLGQAVRSPLLREHVFELRLSADTAPFVSDHVVFGTPVFPATGYIEMATAGALALFGGAEAAIEDLAIEEALAIATDEARVVQIAFSPVEAGRSAFQVFSRDAANTNGDAAWDRHASGTAVVGGAASPAQPGSGLDALKERCATPLEAAGFYQRLSSRGIEYGPRFRGIAQLWRGSDEALALVQTPDSIAAETHLYKAHPAFLDAGLQVLGAALSEAMAAAAGEDLYLPIGIKEIRHVRTPPARVWSHARVHRPEQERPETLVADLQWLDDAGLVIWSALGVTMKRASSHALRRGADRQLKEWLYELDWPVVDSAPEPPANPGMWVVFADESGVAAGVAARLEAAGGRCVTVRAGRTFEKNGHGYTIDPRSTGDLDAVFADLAGHGPIRGVAHLWSLDTDPDVAGLDGLDAAHARVCGSVLSLVHALSRASLAATPRLWLVTRGAATVGLAPWPAALAQAPLAGLARVIAIEQPQWQCTTVDLDPGAPLDTVDRLVAELRGGGDETQVAYRGDARHVARLVRRGRAHVTDRSLPIPDGEGFQLGTSARGVLDNLRFEARERREPGAGEVEIRVHASGLNFRDVLNALGMYPGDPGPMGGECAGRVIRVGDRVHDLAVGDDVLCMAGGAFSKYVVTPAAAVVRLPGNLTYEQGAGIPVTFLTAQYGLHHLAGLKRGDRVLVHAAAGGVGQAAVQIALRAGAEVYGTAGSPEKREFVRAMGVRQVFSSRTADFAPELMALTGGAGVDIVLNSLTGAFIPESLRVLKAGGHFLEIGKAEIWDAARVTAVNPAIAYRPFDLAEVMAHDIGRIASLFGEVMSAMTDGSLKPLPIRVFDLHDAMGAFRFMAQARHVGKIVLSQRELIAAESEGAGLDAHATYLITGGCGGLGLEVAQSLLSRGATHLVLTGRSQPGPAASAAIDAFRTAGATVEVAQGDIARESDVRRILATIARSGHPLRGIVHAAGVLDDGVLTDLSWDRFERVMAPKVRGSWLLHDLTRDHRLDFFVLFSSTSSVLGAPGQANYAAANAFMDALAQYRRAQGMPALSINWGAWGEVGMAARLQARDQSRIADRGVGVIAPEQGLRVLDLLLAQPGSNVIALPVHWPTLLQAYRGGAEPPLLRTMARDAGPREATGPISREPGLKDQLEAVPEAEQPGLLLNFVRTKVARVLGLESGDTLDARAPFTSLGLDSLMAVELRNAMASAVGRSLPSSLVFDHATIEALTGFLSRELLGAEPVQSAAVESSAGAAHWDAVAARLEDLSEDQMAELLASQLAALSGGDAKEP